jgi:hypothetical protein
MNNISTSCSFLLSSIAVAAMASIPAITHADDAGIPRITFVTATAACAGPIPSSDDALRRSPLGIRNQGTKDVFISCSLPGDYVTGQGAAISVVVENFSAAESSVKCTLITGNRLDGFESFANNETLRAGTAFEIGWIFAVKFNVISAYNVSCILPPGVEITTAIKQDRVVYVWP